MSQESFVIKPNLTKSFAVMSFLLAAVISVGSALRKLLSPWGWNNNEDWAVLLVSFAGYWVIGFAIWWVADRLILKRRREWLKIEITPRGIIGPAHSFFQFERVFIDRRANGVSLERTLWDRLQMRQRLRSRDGRVILLDDLAYDAADIRKIREWIGISAS